MIIPNQQIFSLNPSNYPHILSGPLDPSTQASNPTLFNLPPGSIYLQQVVQTGIGVVGAVVWVKILTDSVAQQENLSAWVSLSRSRILTGNQSIDFADPQFANLEVGVYYLQSQAFDTGVYRTLWLKVRQAPTRDAWVSLAETQAFQSVYALLRTNTLSVNVPVVSSYASISWTQIVSGSLALSEQYPTSANMISGAPTITVPTNGLYRINAQVQFDVSDPVILYGQIMQGSTALDIAENSYVPAGTHIISFGGVMRLERNWILRVGVGAVGSGVTVTATRVALSINMEAP